MQMHQHASLPEAMQPLFQQSRQNCSLSLVYSCSPRQPRECNSEPDNKPKYGSNNNPYQCLLLGNSQRISLALVLSGYKEKVPVGSCADSLFLRL